MKYKLEEFENSTRLSRWFYYTKEYAKERDYSSSLYPHMLIEDIHLGLLPIRRTLHTSGFVIRIDPPDNDLEQILCQALESSHRGARHLDYAIDDFIDDVAKMLAHFGEAFYEIVYLYDKPPDYKSFRLVQIPNWGLRKGMFSYIQRLPRQKTNDQKGTVSRVKIPKEDVVYFRLPGGVFAPRFHRRLLKRLDKLSDRNTPTKFMSPEQLGTGFDFSHYHCKKMLEVARSTRKIGWYARQLYQDRTNEFYFVYRHLKFQLWRARLREHIIEMLNESLERVGKKMGFSSKVLIEGIPSAADIETTINDLFGGKIEFSSAVKKTNVS